MPTVGAVTQVASVTLDLVSDAVIDLYSITGGKNFVLTEILFLLVRGDPTGAIVQVIGDGMVVTGGFDLANLTQTGAAIIDFGARVPGGGSGSPNVAVGSCAFLTGILQAQVPVPPADVTAQVQIVAYGFEADPFWKGDWMPRVDFGGDLNGGSFTVPTGAGTAIDLTRELFKNSMLHDNAVNPSQVTVDTGQDGDYIIIGVIDWGSSVAGNHRQAWINVNGTTVSTVSDDRPEISGSLCQVVSILWPLAAGDIVELMGVQDTGGNLSVLGLTRLTMVRVN